MNPVIAISTVADGNMYDRHHPEDADVINNRDMFLGTLGSGVSNAVRVHVNALVRATKENDTNWCRYREVTDADVGMGMHDSAIESADALISRTAGLALFLPVADCIGAAIYDSAQHIMMLSHLGRHSLEQHGAQKSIEHLVNTYSSRATDLRIWMTPAAGKESFPIWALNNQGLKQAAYEQFHLAGIDDSQIVDNPADTTKDSTYYSYSEFLKGNRPIDADYAIVAIIAT